AAGEGGGLERLAGQFGNGSTLTVTGGTIQGNSAHSAGGVGGVLANLTGVTVRGNHADFGGGIGTNANLVNCLIVGNSATHDGGGIRATSVNLIGTTVR